MIDVFNDGRTTMRQAKILGWVIGGCLLALGLLLLAVRLLVDPNHYKTKIIAVCEAATGRGLQLPGDIKLSVFPWIALELGPASLGNPPGFDAAPFVSFTHAAIRVKLLPLLRERLEIARVEIDGMDLRLLKDASGKGNWQSAAPATAVEGEAAAADPAGTIRSLESLADVKIRHGRVSYQNLVVENFELETGSIAGRRNVPISIGFDANRGIAGEQIVMSARFDLSEDAASEQLRLAAINLSGTMSQPDNGRPVHWDVAAPSLDVDLRQQTAAMPAFAVSYSSGKVTGAFAATQLLDQPHVTGSFNIGPLVLHEFVPRLGLSLPRTRDPRALSNLSGSADFSYDSKGLIVDKILLRLDDTQLQGNLEFMGEDSRALKFDLRLDHLDLNRYLAPPGATEGAPSASGHESVAKADIAGATALAVDGTLHIASVAFSTLNLTDLAVTVTSHDAVTRLFPLMASIDGGRYSGDITYDAHAKVPALTMDEHLTAVDMLRLLANTPQRGRISGQATVGIKAAASGAGADALLKSLDGHFDANLTNGAIEGVDVGYELSVAQALLDRQAPASRQDARRTPFDVFKMSAQISNGVAETHDLAISSELLKVAGQGTVSLPTKAINLALLASVYKSATVTAVDVPLKVTGTYTDPTIRPDAEALAKGQLKQKLQDVLKKNGLQGLFGR